MWQIENRSPFAADRGWIRDRDGREIWLVAVKCTFDIRPDGSTPIANEQPPVLRAPEYNGEPGKSSIRVEGDLVLTKTTTDIIVAGHAYAPDRHAVTEMTAGFRVGPVRKELRIVGDREWLGDGRTAPQPFVRMPLVYERAFGGVDRRSPHPDRDVDWRNPVGTGFTISRDNLNGVALPNIEYLEDRFSSWRDHPRPAGFGPISSHWPARARFAGTYDDRWTKERQPLVPADFGARFHQCAPEDQQAPAFLQGGEPVLLTHLTPSGDRTFRLPKVFLGFDTRFRDGSREIHRERKLHTVIIESDYPRVSLVWHSALPCHFKVLKLERTIVTLKTELCERADQGERDGD